VIFQPVLPVFLILLLCAGVAGVAVWMLVRAPRAGGEVVTDRRALAVHRSLWALRLMMVLACAVMLLRPGLPGGSTQTLATDTDIVLVVDTTASIVAEDWDDGSPRIDGVRADVRALVEEYPGARFALLTSDAAAQLRIPLTTDTTALLGSLDVLRPEVTSQSRGSSIGVAAPLLSETLAAAAESSPDRSRMVFYFGDGEQTTGAVRHRGGQPRDDRRAARRRVRAPGGGCRPVAPRRTVEHHGLRGRRRGGHRDRVVLGRRAGRPRRARRGAHARDDPGRPAPRAARSPLGTARSTRHPLTGPETPGIRAGTACTPRPVMVLCYPPEASVPSTGVRRNEPPRSEHLWGSSRGRSSDDDVPTWGRPSNDWGTHMGNSAVWKRTRTGVAGLIVGVMVTAGLVALGGGAAAAADDPGGLPPLLQRDENVVTSDPIPTVQIDNGYVWAQTTIGSTVYAVGKFDNAREPKAPPGTALTARSNVLAYNIDTGALLPFAPQVNGVIKAVAASPDGTRIYIGG